MLNLKLSFLHLRLSDFRRVFLGSHTYDTSITNYIGIALCYRAWFNIQQTEKSIKRAVSKHSMALQ